MPQFSLRVYDFIVWIEAVSATGARHVAERHCYAVKRYRLTTIKQLENERGPT